MNTIAITFNRDVTLNELLEIKQFVENQETNDKYTNTTMHINGNYAEVDIEVNEFGDVIVL